MNSMKVLIIGSGGREHAMAWKLAQSPHVEAIYVAPGNGGTATEKKCQNVAIESNNINQLIEFAKSEQITFTVVGPEAPLSQGIVDKFIAHDLKIWGPTKFCAQLESSKSFAKKFMIDNNIPTAEYKVFTEADAAKHYLRQHKLPVVIKADGLASGKGVLVANTLESAINFIDSIFVDNKFGTAGEKVVIEEFLEGIEASFIVMIDGQHICPLASSQDHKRLLNNDQGPNTGGMGAYSPAPIITDSIHNRVMQEIIKPVVNGMTKLGHNYSGFLYAGLMIDSAGNPKTLEFNCRLGDPETQPILARLKSDFATMILAGIDQQLNNTTPEWKHEYAIGVVIATEGYPDNPKLNDTIDGIEPEEIASLPNNVIIFQAGTKQDTKGNIITTGGRTLTVTGLAPELATAKTNAYNAIRNIHFTGMQYRTDIGDKAI